MVLVNVSRALAAPITLEPDHNDVLAARDSGFLQLHAETCQEVVDSILFEDVVVRRGARLRKVIIDKSSTISERFEIGFDADRDGRNFKISKTGIRVIPKGWTSE